MTFNTVKINPEFEARLEEARAKRMGNISNSRLVSDTAIDYELRKESLSTLSVILARVYETIGFEQDVLDNQIKATRKSEYGRIPAMFNILTKTYAWPISKSGDPKEIGQLQSDIIDTLSSMGVNIDEDLLLDHREAKGYTSFFDSNTTFEIVEGVEPDYDEYKFLTLTLAEKANLPFVDNKITPEIYEQRETKALTRAQLEYEAIQLELANHRELEEA